jgi:lipoprotein NlpI
MDRRIFIATLLACGLCSLAVRAAGYDDFARGIGANLQGDNATAISAFTAAITAGDLSAALLPIAYRGRAVAYMRANQCAAAMKDLSMALQLKPDDGETIGYRAAAEACTGDLQAALADYATLVARHPSPGTYMARGRLRWREHDFSGAADDFLQANGLAPNNAYDLLWLEMSRARAGTLDPAVAKAEVSRLDTEDWPLPLLQLYSGALAPQDVAAKASLGGEAKTAAQRCEADFYVAEWWRVRQDDATAKQLLQTAVEQCPRDFVEYYEALAEMRALK